ncbi:hypothetical protein ACWDA7_07955 [Streptomyces sp. NPDC001156]
MLATLAERLCVFVVFVRATTEHAAIGADFIPVVEQLSAGQFLYLGGSLEGVNPATGG